MRAHPEAPAVAIQDRRPEVPAAPAPQPAREGPHPGSQPRASRSANRAHSSSPARLATAWGCTHLAGSIHTPSPPGAAYMQMPKLILPSLQGCPHPCGVHPDGGARRRHRLDVAHQRGVRLHFHPSLRQVRRHPAVEGHASAAPASVEPLQGRVLVWQRGLSRTPVGAGRDARCGGNDPRECRGSASMRRCEDAGARLEATPGAGSQQCARLSWPARRGPGNKHSHQPPKQ